MTGASRCVIRRFVPRRPFRSSGRLVGEEGLSLAEVLIAAAIMAILAGIAYGSGGDAVARQRLDGNAMVECWGPWVLPRCTRERQRLWFRCPI